MTFPTSDVSTTNLDSSTDGPANARSDFLDLFNKFNLLRNHFSTLGKDLISALTAADARTAIGAQAALGYTPADAATAAVDSAVVHKTGAETVAGVKTFSSAPVLSSGATFGSASMGNPSGAAPLYGARAWCVFDGTLTGTNAPTAGGNIASIQQLSATRWQVNFTAAMPDANYSCLVTAASKPASGNAYYNNIGCEEANRTTTSCVVSFTAGLTGAAPTRIDVAIFR